MTEKKTSETRIRWGQIAVAQTTLKLFKEYCKDQDEEMRVAADEILLFIMKNKIPLGALENMMDKNITSDIKRYHNYTTGFLQTFEKEQKQLMKNLIKNVGGSGAGDGVIFKAFMQEILRDVQFLMTQAPNKTLADSIL